MKRDQVLRMALDDLTLALDSLRGLLNLNPSPLTRKSLGAIDNANEILPADSIIDIFIHYDSFGSPISIEPPPNTTLYPLIFPFSGIRGPIKEIEQIVIAYLGQTASALFPYILGNEPLDIVPTNFTPQSILKPSLSLSGENTLVGIIDTGIDYTNPVFIDENGQTRIISIWDQTIGGSSPDGDGTIYNQDMINQALASPDPFEIVPHKDNVGHGTILAGIAAGFGQYPEGTYEGVAPKADMVVVKLQAAGVAMQTLYHGNYNPLAFSTLDVALAFKYLTSLANLLRKPISICLPMGTNGGAHDGSSVLDTIITSYSSNSGVCTIISVGEEANKSHHASGNLKDNPNQEIKLTIAKGEGGFVVEVWASFGDKLEISLTPPQIGGDDQPTISLNQRQTYRLSDNSSVWSQGGILDVDTGCQVVRFRLEKPAAGDWLIRVKGVVTIEGSYHIWIPKTGMILPATTLSPSSPFTTIYSNSTAVGAIAIGCHDKNAQAACRSSGRGFTRDGRVSPDYIVDATDVLGPLPDNKWGLITGTAAASAITAGVTALIYENQVIDEKELANTVVMKAILADNVTREPTVTYPNPSSGYGLIDIKSDLI